MIDHSVQDIFGIYDTATNLGSLGDRSEDTFLKQKLKPGSIIHSDLRKAYEGMSQIESQPSLFTKKMDPNQIFLDPNTQAHINHVECMWKNVNSKFRCMYGVHLAMLPSYFNKFMWYMQYGITHNDAFNNTLNHVADLYPNTLTSKL